MKDPQPATATARQQAAAELGRRLQALSAARGLDPGELARQANVSRTTLYNLLQGRTASPRASTLARLATVLGVSPESLHPACSPPATAVDRQPSAWQVREIPATRQEFDRSANHMVTTLCEEHPELVADWGEAERDELYSEFGTGGPLTPAGIEQAAERINARRETLDMLRIVLETHLEPVATGMVAALYGMLTAGAGSTAHGGTPSFPAAGLAAPATSASAAVRHADDRPATD